MTNEEKFDTLNKSEIEVVFWREKGDSYEVIASLLGIGVNAVQTRMTNAYDKLGIYTDVKDSKERGRLRKEKGEAVLAKYFYPILRQKVPNEDALNAWRTKRRFVEEELEEKLGEELEEEPIPTPDIFQPTHLSESEQKESTPGELTPNGSVQETKPETTLNEEVLDALKNKGVGAAPPNPSAETPHSDRILDPTPVTSSEPTPQSAPSQTITAWQATRAGWIAIGVAVLFLGVCCISSVVIAWRILPLFINPEPTQRVTPPSILNTQIPSATMPVNQPLTPTRTSTPTRTPSNTPTTTQTPSRTPTPTITPTFTPSFTPTPTLSGPVVAFETHFEKGEFPDWDVIKESPATIGENGVFTSTGDYWASIGDVSWKNYEIHITFDSIPICRWVTHNVRFRAKGQTDSLKMVFCDSVAHLEFRDGRVVPDSEVGWGGDDTTMVIEVNGNHVKYLGKDKVLSEDRTGFIIIELTGNHGLKKLKVVRLP